MDLESVARKSASAKGQNKTIMGIFIEEFKNLFMTPETEWKEIEPAFNWLREEAKCALSFADINALNSCRRIVELYFSNSVQVKKRVWKKSREVSRELLNRFEELRTTRRSTKGKFALFEGHRETEKILPEK